MWEMVNRTTLSGATLIRTTYRQCQRFTQKECTMAQIWDVEGRWDVIQSDGGRVTLDITQEGDQLRGSGTTGGVAGHGIGQAILNQFVFDIQWDSGPHGEYTGMFGINGRLSGIAVDVNNLNSHAYWFATRLFTLKP
jgi:hypothetical protein